MIELSPVRQPLPLVASRIKLHLDSFPIKSLVVCPLAPMMSALATNVCLMYRVCSYCTANYVGRRCDDRHTPRRCSPPHILFRWAEAAEYRQSNIARFTSVESVLASTSSRVPEVAIRRSRLASFSRPETRSHSRKTCGAHRYLATLSNYPEDREDVVHDQRRWVRCCNRAP